MVCGICKQEFEYLSNAKPSEDSIPICGDCAQHLAEEQEAEYERLQAESVTDQMNREAYEDSCRKIDEADSKYL